MGAALSHSNVETVRALIADFFNSHNADAAAEFFAEDFWWTGGSVGVVEGRETYQVVMRQFWRGIPDARAIEEDLLEAGDAVVARFTVEGTHQGDLWGLPASGKPLRWQAVMIYKFRDGKVCQQWAAEDWAAILTQIGAIVPPWAH